MDFKANVQYAAPNGMLRSTSFIIEAKDAKEAQSKAETLASTQANWKKPRVTSVTVWE